MPAHMFCGKSFFCILTNIDHLNGIPLINVMQFKDHYLNQYSLPIHVFRVLKKKYFSLFRGENNVIYFWYQKRYFIFVVVSVLFLMTARLKFLILEKNRIFKTKIKNTQFKMIFLEKLVQLNLFPRKIWLILKYSCWSKTLLVPQGS